MSASVYKSSSPGRKTALRCFGKNRSAGDACGDLSRHRKCLEKTNSDLREQIEKARTGEEPLCRELKRLRGEINDIHKRIVAVTKSLEKTNA